MFTAAEKEIMKCLWANNRPMYVEEVRAWLEDNLGGKRLYKTVQSLLTVLMKKGYVQYEKRSRRVFFNPTNWGHAFFKNENTDKWDLLFDRCKEKNLLPCHIGDCRDYRMGAVAGRPAFFGKTRRG